MRNLDVLNHYLLSVRDTLGASSASCFYGYDAIRDLAKSPERSPLHHDSGVAAVPELADDVTAQAFLAELGETSADGDVAFYRSESKTACLVAITFARPPLPVSTPEKRAQPSPVLPNDTGRLLIGLAFETADTVERLLAGELTAGAEHVTWLLGTGGAMAVEICKLWQLLEDPVSRLPGRAEFDAHLERALALAGRASQSLGLLLLNPDRFDVVNHRFGRRQGDQVIREIAGQLRRLLRGSDAVFHYSGAIFAIVLPGTSTRGADVTASKLIDEMAPIAFLDGAARLTFSVGVAVYEPDEAGQLQGDEAELLRRADNALNVAKLAGGARAILWHPNDMPDPLGVSDQGGGIFTADAVKDYRNMQLLWDTIATVSGVTDVESIAAELTARIAATFKPQTTYLSIGTTGKPDFTAGFELRDEEVVAVGGAGISLDKQDHQLMRTARRTGAPEETRRVNRTAICALPLVARDQCFGCLLIKDEDALSIDPQDISFLRALSNQMAVTLDRANLLSDWMEEKEAESRRLREEVRELRGVVHQSKLVYQSDAMERVLDTLRRVAVTDATLLVTGESGTGKEMLAHALHENSPRRDKQLVVVDCGAIAHSLLEAELFGRVKGAYTGADSETEGYIQRANGGTLFLDEIGELPLDVQAKLLRFVQEKEITPVGSAATRKVDVRIVAATNRSLLDEVSAGRFRKDLYYRLSVVTIISPPLRDRREDILPLAQYFIEKFAVQYGKGAIHLTHDAREFLLDYHWPGNIRELQHAMLRAVLMADGSEINVPELFLESSPITVHAKADLVLDDIDDFSSSRSRMEPAGDARGDAGRAAVPAPTGEQAEDAADETDGIGLLQERLGGLVQKYQGAEPIPMGRWLQEDLLMMADRRSSGVARRAAALLHIAETTYRRQFNKLKKQYRGNEPTREAGWELISGPLESLFDCAVPSDAESLPELGKKLLLREVADRLRDDDGQASQFMDVTIPTYRQWIQQLDQG